MEKILYLFKKFIPTKLFIIFQPGYHYLFNWLAAVFYKFPGNELVVIGVTGTTGKTTSVFLIAKMLEAAGYKVGYTSTAMFHNGQKEWLNDKKMTMIGRFFTQRILRQMVNNGCQVAIIETTSEGIAQYRHKFINYDILVFTGLYPEHIDSHGSFENYKQAKGKLFAHLISCTKKYSDENNRVVKPGTEIKKLGLNRVKKTIIVNGDDEHKDYFLGFKADQKIEFSRNNLDSVLFYGDIKAGSRGTDFNFLNTTVSLQLLGEFNVVNAMCAVAVGIGLEIGVEKIKSGLEAISGVPGRLEKIDEGQDFTVIVDYAFEPNAVKKLYETIELFSSGEVIHVLGATGGGRDIGRRPILGKIAGKNAKFVIVTNEDPYDDDPEIIIKQVAIGAEQAGKKTKKDLFMILDRREAIKKAFVLANENDIVLITGKGSEQAICAANGEKISWDDRAVSRSLLQNENFNK